MKRKVLRLIAAACLGLCGSPASAQSLSFTIDPSASQLFVLVQGNLAGSTPLQGTLLTGYDPFAASLTFSGGSAIQASSTLAQVALPVTHFSGTGISADLTSGLVSVDFSGASFDIVAGTAFDGASASALTWSGSGSALVSGVANLDVQSLLGSGPAVVTFSGTVTPASSFTPTAAAGSIGLQDSAAEATLTIPFDVAMTPSNVVVNVTGTLAGLLDSFITDFINDFFAGPLSRLPGLLAATSDAPLPAPPPVPVSVHWNQSVSGSWDVAANWTPSVNPSAVHDMRIDPAVSVTVTGPSGDTEVRTLEIGGGAGIATLSVLGGKITALMDSVKVLASGVLTGDGTVAGGVLNQGTVRAQNLTIDGGLVNEGVITGNGRLDADIANTTGRISVGPGQAMRIGGSVDNGALGTVEVFNGELQTVGAFSNAGRLAAHHAILRFDGGLANSGQVLVSSGTLDVFGNVHNAASGQVIVSGLATAAFYDHVVNEGEMRAGAGSGIVYFGNVNGAGDFIGPGTHFFEGSFGPGTSPGVATMSNAVFGVDSTLEIELAAGAHDQLVAGNLTLDGGRLFVTLLDGFMPLAGNAFDILDWTTLTGTFGTLELPSLNGALAWNTSLLYLDGTISVAAIPEPQTYALLLAGLGLLGFAARRRKWGQTPFSGKMGSVPIFLSAAEVSAPRGGARPSPGRRD